MKYKGWLKTVLDDVENEMKKNRLVSFRVFGKVMSSEDIPATAGIGGN